MVVAGSRNQVAIFDPALAREQTQAELHRSCDGALRKRHSYCAAGNRKEQKLPAPQNKLPVGRLGGEALHEEAESSFQSRMVPWKLVQVGCGEVAPVGVDIAAKVRN